MRDGDGAGALLAAGNVIVALEGGGLSKGQASNLARFEKKLPNGAQPTVIHDLPLGGKAFQSRVPGRVPGSSAVYEKQVDAAGKTLQYTKTTYAPNGEIVHVKDKMQD